MNLDFRNAAIKSINEIAGDAFATMEVSIEITPVDIDTVLGRFIGQQDCVIFENNDLKAIGSTVSNASGNEGPAFLCGVETFHTIELFAQSGYELGRWGVASLPLTKVSCRSSSTSRQANANFKVALAVAIQKACAEEHVALAIPKSAKKRYFLELADKVITSIKDSDFNLHHMIPKEFGGTDDYYNLLLLPKPVHETYNQWVVEQMAGVKLGETVDFKTLFHPSPLAFGMDFFKDFSLKGIPDSPQILCRTFSYLADCRMLVPLNGMIMKADDGERVPPERAMVCRPGSHNAVGLSVPLFY